MGKGNLESSKILYDKKQYYDSIQLLEQSVEKLAKSVQLHLGFVTVEGLKGHFPMAKIQETARNLLPQFQKFEEIQESNPELALIINSVFIEKPILEEFKGERQRLSGFVETYQNITKPEEMRNTVLMDYKEIEKVLSEVEKFQKSIPKFRKVYVEFTKSKEFNRLIGKIRKNILALPDELDEKYPHLELLKGKTALEKMSNSQFKKVLGALLKHIEKMIFPLMSLNYLSMLLSPHISTTRYPDNAAQVTTTEVYTEKLGIIQSYEHIVKIVEKNIIALDKIFSDSVKVKV